MIHIRPFRVADYLPTLQAMRDFTAARNAATPDEIWLVEHPPVFTQGLAGKGEHVLTAGQIPVIKTERGGQVTYHGPGQVVAYTLIDLQRRRLGVRDLVCQLESAAIATCGRWGVKVVRKPGAPGLYVPAADGTPGAKIASLGLKVSRGSTYHGIALNVAMDLEPFGRINPCGYAGLPVTDLTSRQAAGVAPRTDDVARQFGADLAQHIEHA
ncbi:MAG: lipoyl(octanoyl) transferase LipB [Burkholderiales bacterium]|nr:lipoyl(octanoyl) transferase LipB [Burkholderiales bacterium]